MSDKTIATNKQEMCCECGTQIGVVRGMCNRQHLFCRKCTEKSFRRANNNGFIKNTYYGVIVAFGLILARIKCVPFGLV